MVIALLSGVEVPVSGAEEESSLQPVRVSVARRDAATRDSLNCILLISLNNMHIKLRPNYTHKKQVVRWCLAAYYREGREKQLQ